MARFLRDTHEAALLRHRQRVAEPAGSSRYHSSLTNALGGGYKWQGIGFTQWGLKSITCRRNEERSLMAIQQRGLDIGSGLVPRLGAATRAGIRPRDGRLLDRQTAELYYDKADGDPDAARQLAARDGWRF